MSWSNDEKMLQCLRKLSTANPPKQEFVNRVRTVLITESMKTLQRNHIKRLFSTSVVTVVTASVLAILIFTNPYMNIDQPKAISLKSESIHTQALHNQEEDYVGKQIENHLVWEKQPTRKPEGSTTSPPPKQTIQPTKKIESDRQLTYNKIEDYLQRLMGKNSTNYQVDHSLSDPKKGHYVYTRMINGVPLAEESVIVYVEKNGEINNVSFTNNLKTSLPPNISSTVNFAPMQPMEEAIADRMKLVVINGGKEKSKFVYVSEFEGSIDAVSGEVLVDNERPKEYSTAISILPGKRLLKAKTEQDVSQLLSDYYQIKVEGSPIVNVFGTSTPFKDYIWSNHNGDIIQVKTAGEEGILREFTVSNKRLEIEAEKTWMVDKNLIQIAIKALQSNMPADITQIYVDSIVKKPSVIEINVVRADKGIPIHSEPYQVTVNTATRKVIGIKGNFQPEPLQITVPAKFITKQEAASTFLKNYPPELIYSNMKPTDGETFHPRLVYSVQTAPGKTSYVNAITGELEIGR